MATAIKRQSKTAKVTKHKSKSAVVRPSIKSSKAAPDLEVEGNDHGVFLIPVDVLARLSFVGGRSDASQFADNFNDMERVRNTGFVALHLDSVDVDLLKNVKANELGIKRGRA